MIGGFVPLFLEWLQSTTVPATAVVVAALGVFGMVGPVILIQVAKSRKDSDAGVSAAAEGGPDRTRSKSGVVSEDSADTEAGSNADRDNGGEINQDTRGDADEPSPDPEKSDTERQVDFAELLDADDSAASELGSGAAADSEDAREFDDLTDPAAFHRDLLAPAAIEWETRVARVGEQWTSTLYVAGYPDYPKDGYLSGLFWMGYGQVSTFATSPSSTLMPLDALIFGIVGLFYVLHVLFWVRFFLIVSSMLLPNHWQHLPDIMDQLFANSQNTPKEVGISLGIALGFLALNQLTGALPTALFASVLVPVLVQGLNLRRRLS